MAISQDLLGRLQPIRLLVLDVDGVLTDGSLYFSAEGEMMKAFSVLDGQGIRLLQESGIEVAILSARSSTIVERRARELGIQEVVQGCHTKLPAWQALLTRRGFAPDVCAYIGDDLLDIPIIQRSGLGCTVPHAFPLVQAQADYVTQRSGGQGAVREVAELILTAQDKWSGLMAQYLGIL